MAQATWGLNTVFHTVEMYFRNKSSKCRGNMITLTELSAMSTVYTGTSLLFKFTIRITEKKEGVEIILTFSIIKCHMLWNVTMYLTLLTPWVSLFLFCSILRMQMSPIPNLKKRKPMWYWGHRGLWSHCAWWCWGRWEGEKPQQQRWKFKHPTAPAPGTVLDSVCAAHPVLALLVPYREVCVWAHREIRHCASCTVIHGSVLSSQAAQC
jgi:hypothetical protein